MKKLFVKELLEIYWYLLSGMLIIGILILLGDTLTFMRRSFSLKYIVVALPCCIGLAIYARENHSGSLDFMLSRPIKWWWVYLTKLLVGILYCTVMTAFAALLYYIIMPADYHPFMPITVLYNRALVLWIALLISFICGFTVSGVSSGFAVAISILFGFIVAISVLLFNIYHEVDFACLLCLPAILIVASIICARLPLAANSVKRMKVWFIIVVVFTGYIAANVLFGSRELEMNTYTSVTSPDGKWTAYLDGKNKVPSNSRVALWMSNNDGHKYAIERCVSPTFLMWLQDGDSMLYIANKSTKAKNGPAYLMIAKRSNHWRAEVFAKLPPPGDDISYMDSEIDWTYSEPSKLSPSGAKLAFRYASGSLQLDTYSNLIAVVDMNNHKTYCNKLDICIDFWWIDNNRIAIQTDKKITVVSATGKMQ